MTHATFMKQFEENIKKCNDFCDEMKRRERRYEEYVITSENFGIKPMSFEEFCKRDNRI